MLGDLCLGELSADFCLQASRGPQVTHRSILLNGFAALKKHTARSRKLQSLKPHAGNLAEIAEV